MNNDQKAKVIKQFSKNADSYVTSHSHARGNDLQHIEKWLHPDPDWKVLDIATGGGHTAKTLAPLVNQVFASDLTKTMLQNTASHLRNYENIFFILADAENLPFLDETFDAVTCRIAAHHFPNPEVFLKETSRVLKPEGKFLLIDNVVPEEDTLADFMNRFEKMRDESHVSCLSPSEWNRLTSKYHFEELKRDVHKKTYPFQTWVQRTTDSKNDWKRVENYILDGSNEALSYFSVRNEDNRIVSLEVDEMMSIYEKG
ncbi:class I SAM-dependent methyltransferase [Virgibacillus sp. MSP4-1]|uniref:class I SAM-dependent methyltransferase n=1 Tax=Virgibacillus sp. MSP4-1 TaxID=2700081 RepID=UPI0003A1D6B1|nr:class I SAM-dependent methyltransferase [Virgibacillus sp. MSP4-1]QHS22372.1 class I SAM-dependent methyltransferase [Virgibacillus sp. MSP4-1]